MRERIESLTIGIAVRSIPQILGSLLQTRLTIQQLKVLTSLVVADGMTMGRLAESFGVSMPTMSRISGKLVDQDLVERRLDASDHRSRKLVPTALGRDVVAETLAARPELGSDVLDGLSTTELEALETGLRAISRELHSRGR